MAAQWASCVCRACRCASTDKNHSGPTMRFFVLRTVLAAAVAAAHAQAPYPNRGIRFIVPYAAGGLPDTVARIVAQQLQERIGQSVVVENRPGGGSSPAVS